MRPFKIHTPDTSAQEASQILTATNEQLGLIPNVMAVIAESTTALTVFTQLNAAFSDSRFTATEREVIQIAASVENDGDYCVAGHSSFASKQDVPSHIVAALRALNPVDDPRLEALAQFTRDLIQSRGKVSQTELVHFFDAGFTQAQMIEVIVGICVKVFSNYVSSATSIPLDAAFMPFAWNSEDNESGYLTATNIYP